MPSAFGTNPWILPLVLQQFSDNPREPDLIGCTAHVLSFLPQTRRMEIFDGAHTLQVSLCVAAMEDLDRDEFTLGITSKNVIGHIVAVTGLTLVPDLYSSPLSVIATVKKLTPFCDKMRRPSSCPPGVETDTEVQKILSARLGQCFSSCVLPSFALSGNVGPTGASSICQRAPGPPPRDLLRCVTDFRVEVTREAGPANTLEDHGDLVPEKIPISEGVASCQKLTPCADLKVPPKPLPSSKSTATAATATLMPQTMARPDSGPGLEAKAGKLKMTDENSTVLVKKLTEPASAVRPLAIPFEKSGESAKPVSQRSSDDSSWSDRSPLPVTSIKEDGDINLVGRESEACSSQKDAARSDHIGECPSFIHDRSATDQENSFRKEDLLQSCSEKVSHEVLQASTYQPIGKRILSVIEAAGAAFAAGNNAPRLVATSTETRANEVRHQRGDDSSPEANSPQVASVVAVQKQVRDTEEDGESTVSIPHDDLMQMDRDNETAQTVHQTIDHRRRRARSGLSAAPDGARRAALALAGIRTSVSSCRAEETERLQSNFSRSGTRIPNILNPEMEIRSPSTPRLPTGPSDFNSSPLLKSLHADENNATDHLDVGSDSLDDEADGICGSTDLPETQGNLEFAVGTVNLATGSVEVSKDIDSSRPNEMKMHHLSLKRAPCVRNQYPSHIEGYRELNEIVDECVPTQETPGNYCFSTSRIERKPPAMSSPSQNAGNGKESRGLLNLEQGRPVGSSRGPVNAIAVTSHLVPGPASAEKEKESNEARDNINQVEGSDLTSRRQNDSVPEATFALNRLPVLHGSGGDPRCQREVSAHAMIEEAAKIMSRLMSLNLVQSSNPWHACLAAKSSMISTEDLSKSIYLLDQCMRKRRHDGVSVLPRTMDEPLIVRDKNSPSCECYLCSRVSIPGTILNPLVTEDCPTAAHTSRNVCFRSVADLGDALDTTRSKRQRKNENAKESAEQFPHSASEADVIFFEGCTPSCSRSLAEIATTGDSKHTAPLLKENTVDPRQGFGAHTELMSMNPVALTGLVPTGMVDTVQDTRARCEASSFNSFVELDPVGVSVAKRQWNAVKTLWKQPDFTRHMTVRDETQPNGPPNVLSAADLKKLSSCINAVVEAFVNDLGAESDLPLG